LYVADSNKSRVLEFNAPLANSTANHVFGQGGSFTTGDCNLGGISANSLCDPIGVAIDSSSNVFVADTANHRILEYNSPLATNKTADHVYGQGNVFTTNACNKGGVSANSLRQPRFVAVDGGKSLYVTDTGNNRTLKYTTPLTTAKADKLFGQGSQ